MRVPGSTSRLFVCYVLIPCLLSLLCIVRGTVWAPTLPYWDRVLVFTLPAVPGWIFAGVFIAGLIELTNARSLIATVACTVVGAVLAAAYNYYELSIYYYFMRDRWPWLRPFFHGNVPLFDDSLANFLVGPSSIYFYSAIAITYAGYRTLVPGARYLGDKPGLNPVRAEGQPASIDQAPTPTIKTGDGAPSFIRRLAPHLGPELVLVSAEEHYIRIVTRLGSALVLYRFSDAIEELGGFEGDRVHRSFWIAWSEVVRIQRQGRTYRIKMSSGEEVPVSRSQTGVVARRLSQYDAPVRRKPDMPVEPAVVASIVQRQNPHEFGAQRQAATR